MIVIKLSLKNEKNLPESKNNVIDSSERKNNIITI